MIAFVIVWRIEIKTLTNGRPERSFLKVTSESSGFPLQMSAFIRLFVAAACVFVGSNSLSAQRYSLITNNAPSLCSFVLQNVNSDLTNNSDEKYEWVDKLQPSWTPISFDFGAGPDMGGDYAIVDIFNNGKPVGVFRTEGFDDAFGNRARFNFSVADDPQIFAGSPRSTLNWVQARTHLTDLAPRLYTITISGQPVVLDGSDITEPFIFGNAVYVLLREQRRTNLQTGRDVNPLSYRFEVLVKYLKPTLSDMDLH